MVKPDPMDFFYGAKKMRVIFKILPLLFSFKPEYKFFLIALFLLDYFYLNSIWKINFTYYSSIQKIHVEYLLNSQDAFCV